MPQQIPSPYSQRELYSMANTGLLRREAEMTLTATVGGNETPRT